MAATLTPQQSQIARMLYTLGRSRGLSHQRSLEFVAAAYSESGLNPHARNASSGAEGLYQLLSPGYRTRAQSLGGLDNPRANALSILGDYKSYWASHPGAAPGAGGAAVERSGEGADFYSKGLPLVTAAISAGGPATTPSAPSAAPAPAMAAPPVDTSALRQQALQALIGQIGHKTPDYTDFFGGLSAIKTAEASAPVPAAPTSTPRTVTPSTPAAPSPSGGVKFLGDLHGEKSSFVNAVSRAARAAGATQIRVISGYRSPEHNASVGGATRSNHMTGEAMDAQAFIPGHGWIPLGTLLRASASRYGLRSGDQPGFWQGGRDPNHVDDAANQR